MSQPHPMSLTGAVWCDEHERWECSKNSQRHGGRCHASAIKGTAACRNHAGKRTGLAKAQGEAITAWSALSGQPTVTATEAVLGMLQMSWLRAHLYAGLLREQVDAAQEDRTGGSAGGGNPWQEGAEPVGAGAGLVGHTFAAAPERGIYASGEAIRALAQLEAAERDRCVRYAKTCHDMGIAEQQIELSKAQGLMLAQAIRNILAALNLTAEQAALVPDVVPRELRAISGGAA